MGFLELQKIKGRDTLTDPQQSLRGAETMTGITYRGICRIVRAQGEVKASEPRGFEEKHVHVHVLWHLCSPQSW